MMLCMAFKDIYKSEAKPGPFLFSLLFIGLSYGLYKGVLDNYMAEIAHIGEFDRGVVEFFRELPGLFLIVVLALLAGFSERSLFRIGTATMAVGMALVRFLPPGKALLVLAMTVYSMGEHINLGMKSAISLDMASPLRGGEALGMMSSIGNAGNIVGFIAISVLFSFWGGMKAFKLTFTVSFLLLLVALFFSFSMQGSGRPAKRMERFYFRKKFGKYYMLEIFYGARKQVFLTFGPYVLILFYNAPTNVIGMLYTICAVLGVCFSPLVGKLIDRVGYRIVMIMDTLFLVFVCFFYGFAHLLFPSHVAFILCCASYVLDSVISLASMASSVYVKDIADSPEEVTATLSTGISVNHLVSILIALCGGWIWEHTGVEALFTLSAILGVANSIYAATIAKTGKAIPRRTGR